MLVDGQSWRFELDFAFLVHQDSSQIDFSVGIKISVGIRKLLKYIENLAGVMRPKIDEDHKLTILCQSKLISDEIYNFHVLEYNCINW